MKQCFIINLAYSIILFISLEWLSVSFYIYDQLLKMLRFKPKSTLLMQVQCSLCNDQNTLSSFFKVPRKKCMFSNSKEVLNILDTGSICTKSNQVLITHKNL